MKSDGKKNNGKIMAKQPKVIEKTISEKRKEAGKDTQFKEGDIPNPKGRGKGILNYRTRVTMAIEVLAEKYLKDYNKKHPTKQITIDQVDILGDVFMQAINKARTGDMRAITDLFDRLYNKPTAKLEVSGTDGGPILHAEVIEAGRMRIKKNQAKWFKTPHKK